MKLEYRLDNDSDYPALWYYEQMNAAELVARMTCEYLIKEQKTFVTTETRVDRGVAVIYVKQKEHDYTLEGNYSFIGFEIKCILSDGHYETIEARDIYSHEEALIFLHCDIILVKGREFQLDSRELDEDRNCYVFYGKYL